MIGIGNIMWPVDYMAGWSFDAKEEGCEGVHTNTVLSSRVAKEQ